MSQFFYLVFKFRESVFSMIHSICETFHLSVKFELKYCNSHFQFHFIFFILLYEYLVGNLIYVIFIGLQFYVFSDHYQEHLLGF